MRFMLTAIALAFATSLNAQIVFKGPQTAAPGTMQTITLDQCDGDDLKIEAFQAGESTKSNWNLFRNIDNKYVILVLPQDGDTIYSFVAAISKDKKTYLSTHTLRVQARLVPQPAPLPQPAPPLEAKLRAAYQSSPNAEQLNALISAIDQVVKLDYETQDQVELTYVSTVRKAVTPVQLKGLQQAITEHLLETLGKSGHKTPNLEPLKTVLGILKRL